MINVYILGARGYTKKYGGWETFVHGLIDNWNDQEIHFSVFEKVEKKEEEEIVSVNGVSCIRVAVEQTGSSAMVIFDKKCTDWMIDYLKSNKVENPVMFYLGLRVGPYVKLKRNVLKKNGVKLVENPAGVEWKRTKWNKLIQVYAYAAAMMMAKSMDCLVCDNEGIRNLYRKLLKGKDPDLEFVAYGVNSVPRVGEDIPKSVQNYFKKWGLERDGYYLILGRYVPENNYEMMIKGFMKSKTTRKLLIITNYKTEIQKFHKHIVESTHYESDPRVVMAGTLYDKEVLHYVRQYARGYIHGHSVGGTNPGLLEAMAETNVNILFNVDFNKYVGDGAALYFSNADELSDRIAGVDAMPENKRHEFGVKARQRMHEHYSWQHICDEYDRVFKKVVDSL